MELGLLLIIAFLTVLILMLFWLYIQSLKREAPIFQKILGVLTIISFIVFVIALNTHATPHFKNIDPYIDSCYSPISYRHSFLLLTVHILSVFSIITLYSKALKIPPVFFAACVVFVTLGILSNIQFLYHISEHDTSRIFAWDTGGDINLYMSFYPIMLIIISTAILTKLIRTKAKTHAPLTYQNKWLNIINDKLVQSNNLSLYSFLAVIPFLLIISLILVLFGQDADLVSKAYTETATWKFSQQLHPPTVSDRHGHYLCTVAAFGKPSLVKPIGIGRRNNKPIIINRQLQIANAFEYMIEKNLPKSHNLIRTNYDKYGINLAKRINNQRLSNLTYIRMKPLEWLFLICLYSYFIQPEKIIKEQYRNKI